MADIDLKAATPDTSLPTDGFLFGADSQASASPSVYSVGTVKSAILASPVNVEVSTGDASLTIKNTSTGADADATLFLDVAASDGEAGISYNFGGVERAVAEWREADNQLRLRTLPAAADIDFWTGGSSTLLLNDAGDATLYGKLTAGGPLTINAGTVTTSQPVLDLSQTWNAGLVTFTGLRFNAAGTSDANSAAGSLLLDLQVGGTSRISVRKDGDTTFADGTGRYFAIRPSDAISQTNVEVAANMTFNAGATGVWGYGSEGLRIGSGRTIVFGSHTSNSGDTIISRANTATLQLGAADAAAPVPQFLQVQSVVAGTTNTAGSNFTIKGSAGTGTGAGGSIVFQVAPAGTTGTAQNAYATALTIGSDKSATFAAQVIGVGLQAVNGANYSYVQPTYIRCGGDYSFFTDAGSLKFGAALDTILTRDDAGKLALRNGAAAQTFNIYNTIPSAGNYQRLSLTWSSSTALMMNEGAGSSVDGSVAFNDAALATNATKGFIMVPSCAGAPTGTPSDIPTGQIPLVWDSTNLKLYVYTGGAWKASAAFT